MTQARSMQASFESNSDWFRDNQRYIELQARLACYRNIRRSVEREVVGIGRLLDIGNGGFFNYDTRLAASVTAVDLFLDDGPGPIPNTTFRRGSLLALPFEDGSFDGAVAQNVLHHVTGRTVAGNYANLARCVSEIFRCLRPGGKAVLIESTVNRLFNALERRIFTFVHSRTIGGHPMTFQFTPGQIVHASDRCGFTVERIAYIPRGAFVLQFGYRWPSVLTPARPIELVLRRPLQPAATGRPFAAPERS
jgi:SAM-dependent methyltransferase